MVNRNVGNKGLSKTAKYQGRSQLGRKNGYSCFPPISYHHQHPMRPYYHYYPPPPPAATATTQTMVTPPNYHPHYEYQPPLPSYHHQQGYHPGYVLSAPNDSQRQGPEAINSKQPTKKSTINRQPPPASGRGLDSEQGGTKNVSSSRSSSKPMKYQSRLQAHIPSPPQQQPPTRSRNAINQKQTTTPMPKTKEQYRCPRCSSVFGKWDQCCSHVLQCCHLYGVMATKDVCSEAFRLAPDGRPLYSTKQARLLGFDLISCLEDVDGMPTGKNDSIPSGTKEEGTHAGKKPSISHTLRMVQQQTQQLPMHLPCQQPVKVEEVD
mmetsp:Transcript_5999/g.12434  ORF Transcript_5999/g.12434 Transcript_5999/m.12434 type:complete len:321 (-) Transcript_5999:161-1123(-)